MKVGDRRLVPWFLALLVTLTSLLTACTLPRVSAEDRLFLDLSLDFLDEYRLPKQSFQGTPVGGLSGMTYDAKLGKLYAISDDRSDFAPARFYTLNLSLDTQQPDAIKIAEVKVETVTVLKGEDGQPYAKGTIDPEGIALSPERSLFISSEGVTHDGIPPFVNAYNLKSGQWRQSLPIPKRYLPGVTEDKQPIGVADNLGFEALTISASSSGSGEPFRVFTATESSLAQDQEPTMPEQGAKNRLLHYLVEDGRSLLLSEHLYQLDAPPEGAKYHGLCELLAIDQGGHFLSLERSFGGVFGAKVFQVTTGGATDTANIASFKNGMKGVQPIRKQLLTNLGLLDLPLDNLEGMTLGPRLPDGSRSLLLVSDDNFREEQVTQFLLFRLRKG
ncbi:MAG: esterase-like activity of phytase family protein [Scytolyngbya sp. HA4215-MV1]|nr:esterase-like activity of phytase family protein [Scytolyngbya sp. HA4215-MV1]